MDSDDLVFRCPDCGVPIFPDNGGCGACSCLFCGQPRPGGRARGEYVCSSAACTHAMTNRRSEAGDQVAEFLAAVKAVLDGLTDDVDGPTL